MDEIAVQDDHLEVVRLEPVGAVMQSQYSVAVDSGDL